MTVLTFKGADACYTALLKYDHWTRGATIRRTTAPNQPHSIAEIEKLLLTFHPTEVRRLSWPKHTVGYSNLLRVDVSIIDRMVVKTANS